MIISFILVICCNIDEVETVKSIFGSTLTKIKLHLNIINLPLKGRTLQLFKNNYNFDIQSLVGRDNSLLVPSIKELILSPWS